MQKESKEEYYFLTDRLEEVEWAIGGKCNDIDCDHYMYKDLLKKKYKPVLNHGFSCMKKLRVEKEIVLRLLSQNKYKIYRFEKCVVCKKVLDKLNDKNEIVSFTKKINKDGKTYYEWKGVWTHKKCSSKVKILLGWSKR